MEKQKATSVTSPTVGRGISSYQAGFPDQASPAGDDFVRGELEGDVQFCKDALRDSFLRDWAELSEPRLTPLHDTVARAVASFFTRDGGWVYLTQDMIAAEAGLRRQVVNRALQDLVAVGRFERREMKTHQGHRGQAYRLVGEDCGWDLLKVGIPGRTTVAGFRKELEKFALEDALVEVVKLLPADCDLPDSVLTLLSGINSEREVNTDLLSRMDNPNDNVALSGKNVDSALDSASTAGRDLVTESQMVSIFTEQERTGLTDEDIRASWLDIYPGTEVPGALELLSKSRAFKLVAWLRKQPTPVVPVVEVQLVCTCKEIALGFEDEPSVEAQEMWSPTLERLAQVLPANTFDNWLKDTQGVRCDGAVLVVRVASAFTVSWLEQRMYQDIFRALRACCGDGWDVIFEVSEVPRCPAHGISARAG